jgi:hypothetical protein
MSSSGMKCSKMNNLIIIIIIYLYISNNNINNNNWWRVQIMKLLIIQLFPATYHFVPLRSDFSPDHPGLKHLNLCSSFNLRDQVSHPYKTTGIITRV